MLTQLAPPGAGAAAARRATAWATTSRQTSPRAWAGLSRMPARVVHQYTVAAADGESDRDHAGVYPFREPPRRVTTFSVTTGGPRTTPMPNQSTGRLSTAIPRRPGAGWRQPDQSRVSGTSEASGRWSRRGPSSTGPLRFSVTVAAAYAIAATATETSHDPRVPASGATDPVRPTIAPAWRQRDKLERQPHTGRMVRRHQGHRRHQPAPTGRNRCHCELLPILPRPQNPELPDPQQADRDVVQPAARWRR